MSTPPPPPHSSPLSVASPPPSAASPKSSNTESGLPAGTIAGLVVGAGLGGAAVFIAAVIFFLWYRRRKKKEALRLAAGCPPPLGASKKDPQTSPAIIENSLQPPLTSGILDLEKPSPSPDYIAYGLSQNMLTYEELAKATDGFSDANLIGQGGFGHVYKGMLQNGKLVAVKQLKSGGRQGEREFRAEIETISHVHHRHLVSLVGYCISGAQRLLVYEFVPNNSLEFHLHGNGKPTVDWSTRMRIALGAAKGLAYLHEDCQPKIIHRDIKAANILLDESFEAKVSDFGLAKHSLDTDTHISTQVMGTFGYLAPEYASSGKLTDKSDVFSFGVVLLELITGRLPIDRTQSIYDDSIVDWAMPLLKQALEDGKYDTLVDLKLQNAYDYTEMTRMIASAAACVRHSARLRPRMSQIVRALEGNLSLDELNKGMPFGYSTVYTSYGSTDYTSSQCQEDLRRFQKMVLESHGETASSEYQHPSSSSTDGQKQKVTEKAEPLDLEKISKDSLES